MSVPEPVKIQLGARRERIAVALGALLVLVASVTLFATLRQNGAAAVRVQVLAHRGASAYAPENTMSAFKLAIEQGADWLEMDVQQTKDGQLVVFHDLRVERTTNGRGALRDLTLAEVRQLDAGAWFGAQFAGERVPTFEEVLALASQHNVRIFPEMKDPRLSPGIEERVAAVISAAGYEDRTIVQSFDMASLERLRRINPDIKLAALYTATSPLRGEPPAGVTVIGPPWEVVGMDASLVRDIHASGRQVVVWSVDNVASVRTLANARVDGIITGRPDAVRAALEAQR
ncbi:MAG: glycerophosphodiester phosphodiesterase [Chloroflexi bacterium]|nr:glycerophosphodiester phosphodiesterase [Chloroflexota bacterium]